MEVEESVGEEIHCPECKVLLEERNDQKTRTYLLTPWRFHQRHRSLDKE
jgi:phage FluMu protein Com